MKKKLFSILSVMLIAALSTSTVGAASFKLSSSFKLGSLIADGTVSGLGRTDWVMLLTGSGHASVFCTNPGGNVVPGQSSPHVDAIGIQPLPGNDSLRKNGKAPFYVVATPDIESNPTMAWDVAGCPSSNWTGGADFVYWDFATISLYSPTDITFSSPVATYNFKCVTTRTGPNSTPSTFDDGTISCTQMP
jgi:hypothetical protein